MGTWAKSESDIDDRSYFTSCKNFRDYCLKNDSSVSGLKRKSDITDKKTSLNLFQPVCAQLSDITGSQKRHGRLKYFFLQFLQN